MQIYTQVFSEAYAALNTQQKSAVDLIEGPVMVIAGPGTGKTQILTLRIANILLKTDTKPENILALTFTESGAKAMRERLHRYVGALAYRVAIYTFHGFAERLIREHPDAYTRIIGGRPANDLEKVALIETILEGATSTLLRPIGNPTYYVGHILRELSSLKKEYITPAAFADIIKKQEEVLAGIEKVHQKGAHTGKVRGEYTKKEKAIVKNRELLSVYRQYEALLEEGRLYDFEDMIVETVKALENNEVMLRELQETYQYILADEHQDVNGSQNRILELLSNFHDAPNIFVVGDEKQAIYRFQGASLENFLYFEDIFKNTKTIALTENYRSGQTILDAAHSLVRVEDGPLKELRVELKAKVVEKSILERRAFSHQAVEDGWIAHHVGELIKKGVSPEEIAIIVRTNREVEHIAALLRKEQIVVEASADGDILDHPITHAVQNFIDVVVKTHDQEALFALLHGAYWGITNDDLVRIASARRYDTSLWSLIDNEKKLQALGVSDIAAVQKIAHIVHEAQRREITDAPHRVLEYMVRESGFLDHVLLTDPLEGTRVVRRLYDEIEAMVQQNSAATLRDVSTVFALRRSHRLPLMAPYITTDTHAVQVMTAHKSKGLEFHSVIIPHVVDSAWGGTSRRTYFDIPITKHIDSSLFDAIDDERRLLYVALTRAKEQVFLSYAEENSEGKELSASRLLSDIAADTVTEIDTTSLEAAFDPLAPLTKGSLDVAIDTTLLTTHLAERGLSATALNNYLKSPYTYLYRNVLRIPETQSTPLQFGTAMHGVMEWVSSVIAAGGTMPGASDMKRQLERELSKLPITETEFVRLHEKGLEALVVYTAYITDTFPKHSEVEKTLHVQLPTGIDEFPLLTLTGKLDRLDFDTEGNVTQVVDYKTGKPKTRNDIEGKTKSSKGDYKRQLVFYALLLSLYEDERYQCKTGKLSFIEPDAKGSIHEEIFEITDEEIEALKREIQRVTKEIIGGEFLKTPCDPKECDYCVLAEQLALKKI